jgi:hypothetical protein
VTRVRWLPRSLAAAWALIAIACGGPAVAAPEPAPPIDRTPAAAPDGLRAELRMDGGDATLRAFVERLPASDVRERFPADLESMVDALVALPSALSGHVAPGSPLRVIMVEVEGVPRSALALRLSEPPDAALLHEGGPRGALLLDDSTAIVDDLAIVADDPRMLERALPYLAFSSMVEDVEAGAIVLRVPSVTLRGTVREVLERVLTDQSAALRRSARAALASHPAPPTLGDPEAAVSILEAMLRERLAYLPDLGDGTLTVQPSPSGISLVITAPITPESPLSAALAERVPVSRALATADEDAALIVATGSTDSAQERDVAGLVEAFAELAGDRLSTDERARLTSALEALAHARGPASSLALGATETTGAFASLATIDAPADALLEAPWGRRAPWASGAIGTLTGCDPSEPRGPGPDQAICEERSLATRAAEGRLVAAVGRDASARADRTLAHLAAESLPESPDLARDLDALPTDPFAIVLARPLRALPLIVAFGGPPRTGLPRGDGAIVLALANDDGVLRIVLRGSTAALADLGVVARLFAE